MLVIAPGRQAERAVADWMPRSQLHSSLPKSQPTKVGLVLAGAIDLPRSLEFLVTPAPVERLDCPVRWVLLYCS